MNTGVRLAKNDFILFGDIDLLYAPGAIEALIEKASENTQVYSTVYFLPEGRTDLAEIMSGDWRSIPSSDENGKGGVHLIAKEHLEKIKGYDEYYCFWGVEDRDLYSRLDQLGIKTRWVDRIRNPIFHQWHSDASGGKKGFFPDRWWESMNIHFGIKHDILERNDEYWGNLITENDRKVLSAKEVPFDYKERANWFYKGIVAMNLVERLSMLEPNECLTIRIDIPKNESNKKLRLTNSLIKTLYPQLILESDRSQQFHPNKDLVYCIWQLIKNEDIVGDYHISNDSSGMDIKLMKNFPPYIASI